MAKTRGSWKKGQSGNPNGRPKRYPEFVERVRLEHSEEAIQKLGRAVGRGEQWAVALTLAYAWGRPHEAKADLSEFTTEQLAGELRARLNSEPPRVAESTEPSTH